jgi:RNA polymerase sigma-70 factor, ECF subfamily
MMPLNQSASTQLESVLAEWPDLSELRPALLRATSTQKLDVILWRDVALALACSLQHAPALAVFDGILREEVARVVKPLDADLVDDIAQLLRMKLLVPSADGHCQIERYRGEGALRAWVRAVALRTALNALRGTGRPVLNSQMPGIDAAQASPELALLQVRYRHSFREAFAEAIAGLSARERTVLRLHTIDGLALVRIGALYQKDSSTISRWLEQIRQTLQVATRKHLAVHLNLAPAELESVMRAVDVEMSVSLPRLLAH